MSHNVCAPPLLFLREGFADPCSLVLRPPESLLRWGSSMSSVTVASSRNYLSVMFSTAVRNKCKTEVARGKAPAEGPASYLTDHSPRQPSGDAHNLAYRHRVFGGWPRKFSVVYQIGLERGSTMEVHPKFSKPPHFSENQIASR